MTFKLTFHIRNPRGSAAAVHRADACPSELGKRRYLDLSRHLVEDIYQTLGFLGTALAVWHGTRRHWPEVVNTGVALFVIFFFSKVFDWWWDVMPKSLFFFLMGLAAILLLLVFKRLRGVRP
jgi:hypothetical protein